MKAKETLPKEFEPIYNDFVDACNQHNLRFDSIPKLSIGETKTGDKGLDIEMDLTHGLTQERANEIFKTFIDKYPNCHLSFNTPQYSALEEMLRSKSETVIEVDKGVKLKRI